jgi:hypothetical protein
LASPYSRLKEVEEVDDEVAKHVADCHLGFSSFKFERSTSGRK